MNKAEQYKLGYIFSFILGILGICIAFVMLGFLSGLLSIVVFFCGIYAVFCFAMNFLIENVDGKMVRK